MKKYILQTFFLLNLIFLYVFSWKTQIFEASVLYYPTLGLFFFSSFFIFKENRNYFKKQLWFSSLVSICLALVIGAFFLGAMSVFKNFTFSSSDAFDSLKTVISSFFWLLPISAFVYTTFVLIFKRKALNFNPDNQ